ncbi:carbohydrate-binding protein with CBM35 doain [Motilibacter rhizosphaerae]|uniref:Carbohydrate-binding protein with CBM35 doain n=1 Tax=Motilibacter rhizosphaerae TaxID=598652 RepID=A0A4Q7NR10_9ACTN|nr:family 43 glycosylhydrolase [Motilibacter rhizosphaerae]RZS87050.1 carbohydrate-binding protein with CBM35 doain [Motilibacter rhizosphaerae]
MPPQSRRWRARLAVTLLAVGLAAPALSGTASAAAKRDDGSHLPIAPVIDSNVPDPDVLLVDGVYHAYATNDHGQNIQHQTSTDLRHWTPQPDALPQLGAWTGPCSFAPGGATDSCVWAPDVQQVPGGFAMYYTARDAASQKQCIGVATASTPAGPFTPVGDQPLVCPTQTNPPDLGGAIDAATYREGGQLWLLWKADGNCCSKPATIYVQPLSADGTTLTGPGTELIHNDQPWEGAVVEGPTLVKHGGTYYLFYSANDFYGGNYRTGWATATSITGPYTKRGELMTSDRFQGDVRGPGGQDVVTRPDGSTVIIFHGWDPTFTYRAMYTSPLTWSADGTPVVQAEATRYEAEDGTITDARVVGDDSASGGKKVGGLDNADSSVTVRVHRDAAGPATIGIRYANGSFDGPNRVLSSDHLSINGVAQADVVFPHTTWGNWQNAERRVDLKAGWNTVTLTKATYYAEIDAIDVYDHAPQPLPFVTPANPVGATRYEAEAGTVTHARVVGDDSASGGAKVGGLDFPDSSVSVQVYAPHTQKAQLGIRFANGSERGGYLLRSSDRVTVNGQDQGTVFFPHTRWGDWQTLSTEIRLHKGWNTVTLTKVSFYAEIDALDVTLLG